MQNAIAGVSRRTWATFAMLVAGLVLAKILFVLVPTRFPLATQTIAFSWLSIFAISLFGIVGLILGPRGGIPDAWDPRVSNWQRFGLPVVDGVAYGFLTVLRDLGHPVDVHLAFPLSVPFYAFGAVFLEVLLRLFGLTVLTVLLWRVLLRGRAYGLAFWTSNVATSLYEPLPSIMQQVSTASRLAVPGIWVDAFFQPLFLANMLTGYLYRRSGFMAAVVLRLAFYAVWHVAYGGFRVKWIGV